MHRSVKGFHDGRRNKRKRERKRRKDKVNEMGKMQEHSGTVRLDRPTDTHTDRHTGSGQVDPKQTRLVSTQA